MKKPSFVLAPVALCLAVLATATARADRLDATLVLGGTAAASVTAPGDVATVGFLVNQGVGRKLTFQIKRAKGSTLAPVATLVAPDGTVYDIATHGGSVVAKPTTWSAKLPDVPQTGLWRLEVRGAPGSSGGFTATIKGKDALALKSSPTSPPAILQNGKQDLVIDAGDNVAVTVAVKRAGGNKTLVPQLAIFDRYGLPLSATPVASGNDKTGALSLKSYRLPVFGRYTLRFTGKGGTGGSFSYSISTAPAKLKGALPTAVPGDSAEVEPGLAMTLDGSHSQPAAGQSLAYRWTQVSGPDVVLTGSTTSQPTFTAPDITTNSVVSLGFQLAVTEAGAVSKAVTLGVEIAKRPVGDAGRSQVVASAAAVTLDGSRSFDRRGNGLAYAWRQIPGDDAAVTLSDAKAASPTFTAPAGNHTLHFGLTVDDGNARGFEDVAVVEVGTATPFVADAGREQYVPRMASVHLCGLGTRTATGVLDSGLQWTQISGTPVILANATSPWASFTAPRAAGDLVFELTAGGVAATADRVTVHVRAFESNLPAPAKATGPLNAVSGSVDLKADTTVDPEAKPLNYLWAQVSGASLPLTSAGAAIATTTIPAGNSVYAFAVFANDGLQYGTPDVASVRNSAYVGLPVAIASDVPTATQSRTIPVTVTLDARASSRTDGQTGVTYQWTQMSGKDWFDVATSPLAFNPTAAQPQFRIPVDVSSITTTRTLVFQLVVTGGASASLPDFVSVTIQNLPQNGAPVVTAQASDTAPIVGATVTLQGTATDHENDPLTYAWTQTSGAALTLSPNATVLSPTLVAPSAGTYVFQLAVTDGFDTTKSSLVSITVNQKPTASIAVSPLVGSPGTFVTMDGAASNDPEGAALTYQWSQISGTTLSGLTLTNPAISFTAPAGAVSFRLIVNDGKQSSDPKNATFSGNPPPTVNPSVSGVDATYGGSYGSTVTLNAGPGAGGPFTFTWRQINSGSDPTVSLSSTTAQNPTFSVPMPSTTPFGQSPQATFGVKASDGVQTSAESTVVVKFFASLNNGTVSQTTSTVYAIIQSRCTSCHAGTSNTSPAGSGSNGLFYGMGTKTAFLTNSRGATALASSSKKRLPAASTTGASGTNAYLFDRVSGGASPAMPSSGGALSTADKNLLQDWIDQGVQDN